jgi:CBS domain-containing protein
MSSPVIYNTTFPSLADTDTVADATRRMLDDRVSDLPVVDAGGNLVGMFRIDRLYAALLPRAALLGEGLPDLAFVSDTLGQLRARMREIEHLPVREFTVQPDHVVHPDTPPLQVLLLLHHGANNIPVLVPGTSKLAGMVAARDVLTALAAKGTA